MLKLMRDSFHKLKWILLAVVAAFVFGFVFIDMGLGGGAVGGNADERAYAARVNGETITFNDYFRSVKRLEDTYRQMYGQQFTPEMAIAMGLPKQVIDGMVDDRLLAQEAERLNITASPEEVREKLLEIPTFKQNGKFIGMELYTRYVTGPLGYSNAADFESDLAREITLQKMDSALRSSIVVSQKAADDEYRRTTESAAIRLVTVRAAQQAASIAVSPAEVEAYYKANQAKYQHGEQRSLRYLLADYSKLRTLMKPSESDLRARYEAEKDRFRRPASARVLHILVKVDPGAPADQEAAAKAKADSLVAQLRGGADFAALARANSDDPSSSGNGGDMGFVEMGQTVPPFERAVFSVPIGQISDPIRTPEYGFHIVKVLERREAGTRSFEEVRPELTARAAGDLAREAARAEITRLNALIKQKKPATSEEFSKLANDRATSNDSGWFARGNTVPGIGPQPALMEWVFAAKKGDVSDPISTQRGMLIAYVADTRGPGVAPLDEIRRRVEAAVRQQKAAEAARQSLSAMMQGAASIDDVGTKAGSPAREVNVTRETGIEGVSGDVRALVDAAINGKPGEIKGPFTVREGAVAFQIVSQKRVTPQELAQNRAQTVDRLRGTQMRNLRTALLERLRKKASIEINDEITRPTVTPTGV